MEVVRLDRGGELITEFHGFRRGLDFDFVFRLPVFLNPQDDLRGNLVGNLIDSGPSTQRRILGDNDFRFNGTQRIGLKFFDFHRLLAATIHQGESAGLVGPTRFIGLEIADIAQVELEMHLVTGLIERTIGYAITHVAICIFP